MRKTKKKVGKKRTISVGADERIPYVTSSLSGPNDHWRDGPLVGRYADIKRLIVNSAMSPKVDNVNHPPHYTKHPSGVECVDVTEHMSFNIGNAIKYLWRLGLKSKDTKSDLEKAKWYIAREIDRLHPTLKWVVHTPSLGWVLDDFGRFSSYPNAKKFRTKEEADRVAMLRGGSTYLWEKTII